MRAEREFDRVVTTIRGESIEATIAYHSEGRARKGTRFSPPEYPSIHIDGIATTDEDDQTIVLEESDFSADEWTRIEEAAADDYDASRYDPSLDYPEYE